jgi:hypothetical protein
MGRLKVERIQSKRSASGESDVPGGNDQRKKYLINDFGNRFVGNLSDSDDNFMKDEAEGEAQNPARQPLGIDLAALDGSLDQFLEGIFLESGIQKIRLLFRHVLAHLEDEAKLLRRGSVGKSPQQKAQFVAKVAEIGHRQRVGSYMACNGRGCETRTAWPSTVENRSAGARALDHCLEREIRVTASRELRPGSIENGLFQRCASPPRYDLIIHSS